MCTNLSELVLRMFKIVSLVFLLVRVLVPLIIIVPSIISVGASAASSNPEKLKENIKTIGVRVLAGAVIFFLPGIINTIFSLTGADIYNNNLMCLLNVTDATIEQAKLKTVEKECNITLEDLDAHELEDCSNLVDKLDNSDPAKATYQEKVKTMQSTLDEWSRKSKAARAEAIRNAEINTGSSGTVSTSNTQATSLSDLAAKADGGDKDAQKEFFAKITNVVKPQASKYGMNTAVVVAQILQETGWLRKTNPLVQKNNVLSVNYDMFKYDTPKSGQKYSQIHGSFPMPAWSTYKTYETFRVSAGGGGHRNDKMRTYKSMEDCVEDYAALMVGYRPWLYGADVNATIDGSNGKTGISAYAEDGSYGRSLHKFINKYNLEQYAK